MDVEYVQLNFVQNLDLSISPLYRVPHTLDTQVVFLALGGSTTYPSCACYVDGAVVAVVFTQHEALLTWAEMPGFAISGVVCCCGESCIVAEMVGV
jgi:hypothetical protein